MKRVKSRLAILMAERDPRMSQRELAKNSGVSAMAVNRLYNNDFKRVDTDTLEKLCKYLECDLSELLVLKEDQPPRKTLAKTVDSSKTWIQPKSDDFPENSSGAKSRKRNRSFKSIEAA